MSNKLSPIRRLEQSLGVGNLWLSVLALSSKNKVYAYNLPEQIEKKHNFKPSRLLVYLVLYRLEAEGLLHSSEDGRRRYYSITASGKACLKLGKSLLVKRARSL